MHMHIHASAIAVVNTAWSLLAVVAAELYVHACLVALVLLLLLLLLLLLRLVLHFVMPSSCC
jgi:hypothetical protein